MQNELFIALIAGLSGMLGWGFSDFFAKKTIDVIGPIASLVWAHLFGTIILVFFAFVQFMVFGKPVYIPTSPLIWAGLLFFGALQMVVYWFVYEGFGKGQVAVLNPLFASFAGFVAFISILFLGEPGGTLKILSLAVLFIGVILISIDASTLRFGKITFGNIPGFKEIIIATVLATVWTLGWGKFVDGAPWLSYALIMYFFMTVAAFVIARVRRVKLSGIDPKIWKFLVAIGLGEAVAYAGISLGYGMTPLVSIVALLSGAFSLPVIILARIFLKEKVSRVQTIGSMVIIIGIVFLSLV